MPREDARLRRTAVLANPHAARVDDAVLLRLRHEHTSAAVFVCDTPDAIDAHITTILQRQDDIIVCAGGDGTLAAIMAALCRRGRGSQDAPAPAIAALPLGTGNALAHWVGLRGLERNLEALRAIRRGAAFKTQVLRAIEDSWGHRFYFGGMGIDALVLDDYNHLRRRLVNTPIAPWTRGLGGYSAAVLLSSLPTLCRSPLPVVARVHTVERAVRLPADGVSRGIELAAGSCLWGPLSLLAVGTAPTIGYGLRMFPFIPHDGQRMQLRLSTAGPATVLMHLPQIWRGTWRHTTLIDFLVRRVRIALARPCSYQTSGDAHGPVEIVELALAPERFDLVDLRSVGPNS